MNPLFAGLSTTVFEEMSALARGLGAVNLGQGFPDNDGPDDVRARAAEAIVSGPNQYPPMLGLPALRSAVSTHYQRVHGVSFDPDQEIVVTAGATEALAATLLALIAPGDEVVLMQPMFDVYLPLVLQAGGRPKFVTLRPPAWCLDGADLEEAFSPNTRLVIFNSPQNPAATAYDEAQLALLADLCRRFDVIAVCDEVWEHIVFDGVRHVPLCALPGMAGRCVKIGSAGKIFSLTGWKVGWACAPPRLAGVIAKAHQFLTFTVAPATQTAAAYGLGKDDGYFETMRAGYQRSRDRLASGLAAGGLVTLPSQGTYFLNLDLEASAIAVDDRTFCLRAVREAGVAAIPVSAFYAKDPVTSIVRLCFAKNDDTVDAGTERLIRAAALMR